MCTETFKTYTNSRFISRLNATHFENRCQCGMCSECIRQKRSEWSLRAFYEAKKTFSSFPSSFCLFDTLTYDDEHLRYFHDIYKPALYNCWDFSSFSRDDLKRFFKRLRVNLERDGFDVKDKLRYLVTCEYGSDKVYIDNNGRFRKATERPHYHIIFFVTFFIDPIVFSRYISTSWSLGKTDGVAPLNCSNPYIYQSRHYVLAKRVFRGVGQGLNIMTRYVVKYITKDLYLYKRLFKRVFCSFSISNPNWQDSYSGRLAFRRFKNQVLPFHVQSKGFGEYALKDVGIDEILANNALRLPYAKNGVVAFIPLPQYYKRKLFYRYAYFEGRLRWFLTEAGKVWRKLQIYKQIDNFSRRLAAWDSSIDAMAISRYHFIRRGVLMPRFMLSYSDDELLDELLVVPSLRPLHDTGFLFYNHALERDFYKRGRYISDSYDSDIIEKDTIAYRSSLSGFVKFPPSDVLVYHDEYYDSILDDFFDYQRVIGEALDSVQSYSDEVVYRYKQLGLLN